MAMDGSPYCIALRRSRGGAGGGEAPPALLFTFYPSPVGCKETRYISRYATRQRRAMSVSAPTRVGPLAKLDESYSSDGQTYRHKFGNTICALCSSPITRAEETHAWYCRFGMCDAKCHISCMSGRIENQISSTNVRSVACPKCNTRLDRDDREDVMVLAVGDLSRRLDVSEQSRVEAVRAREESERVREEFRRECEDRKRESDEFRRAYEDSKREREREREERERERKERERERKEFERVNDEMRAHINSVNFRSLERPLEEELRKIIADQSELISTQKEQLAAQTVQMDALKDEIVVLKKMVSDLVQRVPV